MANGVLRTFRVECYPGFWIIHCGNSFTTTNSASELLSLLKASESGFAEKAAAFAARTASTLKAETVEAFYSRTGQTGASLQRQSAAEKPVAAGITLDFLLSKE